MDTAADGKNAGLGSDAGKRLDQHRCDGCHRDLGSKAVPIFRHSIFSYNQVGGLNNFTRMPGMSKNIIGFRCPFCFEETYTKERRLLDTVDPVTLSRNVRMTVFALVVLGACGWMVWNSGGY
jgi:hypothetical protein